MPVSYQKEVEDEEEMQQQPEVNLSDVLTEPSSEDTWKGIAPMPPPLISPTDEVSRVSLVSFPYSSLYLTPPHPYQ